MADLSRQKIVPGLLLYGLFFLVCLAVGILVLSQQYTSLMPNLSFTAFLKTPAKEFANYMGPADMASYINGAIFFLKNGHFESWFTNLWPPGQGFTLAVMFKFLGENDYPLKMLMLTVAIWSLAFLFVYHSLQIKNRYLKLILTFTPFYFESFRSWIFGAGMFLTEDLTLPLFVISICFLLNWLRTDKILHLVFMSATFALMAYYRNYFGLFAYFMVFVILMALSLQLMRAFLIEKIKFSTLTFWQIVKNIYRSRNLIFGKRIKSLIIAAAVFMALFLPWQAYNYLHHGAYGRLNDDYRWKLAWEPDSALGIFKDSTINTACHVNAGLCDFLYKMDGDPKNLHLDMRVYRNLTVITFLTSPLKWYNFKLKHFNLFWFSGYSWHDLIHNYFLFFFENTLILLAGIVSILLSKFNRNGLSEKVYGLGQFSNLFVLFNLLLFAFVHFESRFALFLQIYFVYLPIWLFFAFEKSPVQNLKLLWPLFRKSKAEKQIAG